MPRKPQAIDLFSGCGGLTLGLKKAGFRVIGAVEIDPLATQTYRKNHKRVFVWEDDIRKLTVAEVRRTLNLSSGQLDLLAGCPPCQGFSAMTTLNGKRRGKNPSNELVLQFIRFVRGLKPKAIMIENVPKLARDRRIRDIKRQLRVLGYKYSVKVLNAADYSVPQRRRRMILLGAIKRKIPFAPPTPTRKTVRNAIGKLGKWASRDPLHTIGESRSRKISALIRAIPKNGGSRADLGKKRQLRCHRQCNGFKDVYGRMSWAQPAPTITGGCCNPSKGRFLHPIRNRTITLREAALLQSFPSDYYFSLARGKFATAQMIGNALPPEFIRQHAFQVATFLRERRPKAIFKK